VKDPPVRMINHYELHSKACSSGCTEQPTSLGINVVEPAGLPHTHVGAAHTVAASTAVPCQERSAPGSGMCGITGRHTSAKSGILQDSRTLTTCAISKVLSKDGTFGYTEQPILMEDSVVMPARLPNTQGPLAIAAAVSRERPSMSSGMRETGGLESCCAQSQACAIFAELRTSPAYAHAESNQRSSFVYVRTHARCHAPALIIDEPTVERGGLQNEMAEPRAKASAVEHWGLKGGMLSNTSACTPCLPPVLPALELVVTDLLVESVVEFGGRDKDWPVLVSARAIAATRPSISAVVQSPAPGLIVDKTPVELGELKRTSSSQDQESSALLDARTSSHLEHASLEPRSLPVRTSLFHASNSSSPPAVFFPARITSGMVALVSAVIRTSLTAHLGNSPVGGYIALYLGWKREGISTPRSH
jgi:hypothetical protein